MTRAGDQSRCVYVSVRAFLQTHVSRHWHMHESTNLTKDDPLAACHHSCVCMLACLARSPGWLISSRSLVSVDARFEAQK